MKSSKLIELFKTKNIVIPLYLLKSYKDFALELDEFVFLMYLYNVGDNSLFDIEKISDELGITSKEILVYISNLTDKKLIDIKTVKSDKISVEKISLEGFYTKLGLLVMDNINNTNNDNSSVYEMIEKEFGRTLSPMEYEIINEWLNTNISEELIREALKEATYSGVSNLRYIDKILYEWGKLGIKTKEDISKKKKNRKENKKVDLDNVDLDWNWFDDGEEE